MRFVQMPRLNSLGLKVLLAFLAGTLLSIVLLVAAAVLALQGNVLARIDMGDAAEDMAGRIRFDDRGMPVGVEEDSAALGWISESLRHELAFRILDDSGKVVMLSPAGAAAWPADTPRLMPERFDFERDGVAMYGATEPVAHEGKTWYLQVAVSARFMMLLHRVALPLVVESIALFSLVLLIAFGLCAYVTLRYTLKPLRDVSDAAAAISPRSLHARLQAESVPAELAPLVDSFNRVLERLEHGYRLQREFLASAAHELKTPLALIRAQIELGAEKDRVALLGDVEYMTRQVQQLLLLAEASEAANYAFVPVSVREIAGEVLAYLQRMADAADVGLVLSGGTATWSADRGGLFTLLKNLLENAIQHAPAGTVVSVEIQGDGLTVRDRGPGVEAVQLPLLFERFWRSSRRRDHGAGLGLAICREIALAHGWQLTAELAEPGLRFRLSPAACVDCP